METRRDHQKSCWRYQLTSASAATAAAVTTGPQPSSLHQRTSALPRSLRDFSSVFGFKLSMLSEIFLVSAIIGSVQVQKVDCANEVMRARAYIFEAVKGGNPTNNIGVIDFEQIGTLVKLNGTVSGLKPGPHGFHVHEKGDLGNGCVAAAGHFNPHKMMHGAPDDSNRHVGDLGNINTPDSGDTPISISDSVISLTGQHNIIGRAIVIHADADDLGRGNSEQSKTTGNAGERVACGVIGILDEVEVMPTTQALPLLNDSAIEQGGGVPRATASGGRLLSTVWVWLVTVFITRILIL